MLDDVDFKLLSLLAENARASLRDLSKKLGVAVSTVHTRLQKLVKEGVIKRFTIEPDFDKLGYPITAVILVYTESGRIEEAANMLCREPNLVAVYDVTGEFDLVLIGKFRNMGELNKFLKKLNKLEFIRRTVTSVVLKVAKEDYTSPLRATGATTY